MKLLAIGVAHDFGIGGIKQYRKPQKIFFIEEKGKRGQWKTYLEIIDKSGQIRHLYSKGDSGLTITEYGENLCIRIVAGNFSFPKKSNPN